MDPAITKLALKMARPMLFAGFSSLRSELARRRGEGGLLTSIAEIEDALDEATGALAGDAPNLASAVRGIKSLISRPKVFMDGAPQRWIRTERAQTCVKAAVLALLRGEDDAPWAEAAILHYRNFLEDGDDDIEADEGFLYAEALDFVLRSLRRDLTLGDRMILGALEGVRDEVARMRAPHTGAIVDAHVMERMERIRRARFFRSSDTQGEIAALAEAVIDGDLRGATASVRVFVLAWGVRLTSFENDTLARLWLEHALALAAPDCDELLAARAFVASIDEGEAGLGLLDVDASPLQATVAFQIMRHTLGTQPALARAAVAGIDMAALDSDGRFALLTSFVEVGSWDKAAAAAAQLGERDFEETPALLWVAASVLVASRLPDDLRGLVLQSVPANPAGFPLGSDNASIAARRFARNLIERAAASCDVLDLPLEAAGARRYGLWLALRDPEGEVDAREQLRKHLREPGGDLVWLPLALGFGLEIDRQAAEHAIEKSLARHADPSPDTVGAMIALLLDYAPGNPQLAIDFLERHRKIFEDHLDDSSLISLRIKLLADVGKAGEARALLEMQGADFLPAHLRAMLDQTLDEEDPGEAIAVLEAAYAEMPQTTTLLGLLRRYREAGTPPRYVELAHKLLGEIPDLEFAEDIIAHLSSLRRDADALELLELLGDTAERSAKLLAEAGWIYFRCGRFSHAESILERLEAQRDNSNDRALRYQLLITTGRWEALDGFLEAQWQRRDRRTPLELVQCATLAAQVGAKRVGDFAIAAVTAAPQSPNVLVAAYSAVTNAGLEEAIPDAGNWIVRAADLSDETGPVHLQSIEALLDGAPAWEARTEEALKAQAGGGLPIGMIAAMLNRPWLELHLAPLITNPQVADPRKHSAVGLSSGRQRFADDEIFDVRAISLDRTALTTLAALDVLDPVLAAFDQVYVHHDLFRDLFQQRNRVAFHQPSRIAFAHRLAGLVTRDKVRPFQPSRVADLDLVADIGLERAEMLGEAAAHDDGRHFLVHPFPIKRVGSLLAETAPLDRYEAQLVSCSGVVDALVREGRLTSTETAAALGYLQLHEERWPREPRIEKGATLYLSDLAVSYFRYVGLLDRIVEAGLVPVVSQAQLSEARGLLDAEVQSDEVDAVLTRMRVALQRGYEQGRIVFDPLPPSVSSDRDDDSEEDGDTDATAALIARSSTFVTDDRFLNCHNYFTHDDGRSRILSSLDLISLLASNDRFDRDCIPRIRTTLRRGGALFVPLNIDELSALIAETDLDDILSNTETDRPRILETGDLRAIRENVRLIQARGWLDPLVDAPWLLQLHHAIASVLAAQWNGDVPAALAQARSNWLVRLLDTRGWADSMIRRDMEDLAAHGAILDLAKLVGAGNQLDGEARRSYEGWLETQVVAPLLAREPALRPILETHLRLVVRGVAEGMVRDLEGMDLPQAARFVFDAMPGFLQLGMLQDDAFQDLVGYAIEATMEVGAASFARQRMFEATKALYAEPTGEQVLEDVQGRLWQVDTVPAEGWRLRFRHGGTLYSVPGLLGLHPDAESRITMFDAVLNDRDVASEALAVWRERLSTKPLEANEIELLDSAVRCFPPMVTQMITDALDEGGVAPSVLVPRDVDYYLRLVGMSEAETLSDFLVDPARNAMDWMAGAPTNRAAYLLLRAARPGIVERDQLGELTSEDWHVLGQWALEHGDLLAKVGFAELALPIAHEDSELERLVLAITNEIDALDPADESSPLHLLSCLTIFVDGELSLQGTLSQWPPFRRRLAALAQASLIARIVMGQIETGRFADFCAQERGWRFVVQNLIDIRREPRWRPDLIAAEQLRHELLGRLTNAAFELDETQLTPALAACFTASEGSLRARLAIPMAFWPGPLEGGINKELRVPPDSILAAVEEGLDRESLEVEVVNSIVNLQTMFTLPVDLAQRIADEVRETGPKLLALLESEQVPGFLLGLAHFAACRRMTDLADTVQVMARYHRERTRVLVQEEMQIALYAAAAREELGEWRDKLGSWTLELAIKARDTDEARTLLNWIETLCEGDPPLRARTGRARANLNLVLQH